VQSRTVQRRTSAICGAIRYAIQRLSYTGNAAAWSGLERIETGRKESEQPSPNQFLSMAQRRMLLEATEDRFFVAIYQAVLTTASRLCEMSKATVADFDASMGTVRLVHNKGKRGLPRTRHAPVPPVGMPLFIEATRGKIGQALLFPRDASGRPWKPTPLWRAWCVARDRANAAGAGIGAGATCNSARHTAIRERLQVLQLDPLTVAQMSGMSLEMLQKAYFQYIPDFAREKLAALVI